MTEEQASHLSALKDLTSRVNKILDLLDNGDVIEDLRVGSSAWAVLLQVTKKLRVLKILLAEDRIESRIDAQVPRPLMDPQVGDVVVKVVDGVRRRRTVVERDGYHVVYLPDPGMYAGECELPAWVAWCMGAEVVEEANRG